MKKNYVLGLIIVFIIGVVIYLFWPHKVDYNKLYGSYSNKNIAQVIENTISEIYISPEKEFNSNLSKISLDMNLSGIKNICSITPYSNTENILKLAGVDWKYANLWERKLFEDGGSDIISNSLFLVRNNNTIIPVAYLGESVKITGDISLNKKSDFYKSKCKTDKTDDFSACCSLTSSNLRIKIDSQKNNKVAVINLTN